MKIILAMLAGVFLSIVLKLGIFWGLISKVSLLVQFIAVIILVSVVAVTLEPLITKIWVVIILMTSSVISGVFFLIMVIIGMSLYDDVIAVMSFKLMLTITIVLMVFVAKRIQREEPKLLSFIMGLLVLILLL